MQRKDHPLWLLIVMLALAACAGQGAPALPSPAVPQGEGGRPPPPSPWTSEMLGFRLQAPHGFEIRPATESEIVILAPPETSGHRERAIISVEDAAGLSIDQLADGLVAGFEGFEIERRELTFAGQAAVLLDRLPGQDLNRQLLVVNDGRLYRLMFIPSNPDQAEAYQQMEALYAATLDSFEFLPVASEPESDLEAFKSGLIQALEGRDPEALRGLMGSSFRFGFWRGEGYQVSADEALAQLLENYLPAGASLNFDPAADLAGLLDGIDPYTLLGPDVDVAMALYSSGWGADQAGEAVLHMTRGAAGDLFWDGILLAPEGF